MTTPKRHTLLKKIFSLLSVIRGYNILILIAAQYLAAIFIFSEKKLLKPVIYDLHLLYLVIATVCVVAAGYIINNFYDLKADKINKPVKFGVDKYIRQETQLSLYFLLNFLGFSFGWLVSWRAALFFAVYIFGIWFYSHKLKKLPITGLLTASTLTILPFFVVFIHYKNFSEVIFVHAFFLFIIIIIRELIKDLENIKGAIINQYNTFPVVFGEKKTKIFTTLLLGISLAPTMLLFFNKSIEHMRYYFAFASIILFILIILIWKSKERKHYVIIHNILKFLLLIGVFSLLLIDKSLLLDRLTNNII